MTEQRVSAVNQLTRLSAPSGGFAMLALDQRESLREMFLPDPRGHLVGDDALSAFKKTAAEVLTPFVTGVLMDRPLAVREPVRPSFIADGCGLILAVDVLESARGRGVLSTSLDPLVDETFIRGTDAAAIKFLVMWRREADPMRTELVARFLELARSSGVASFVEGIVRPPLGAEWIDAADRHEAILEAADDLSPGADVYKAEVPGYVPGDLSGVRAGASALSSIIDGPWVVLSNGVRQADFIPAVAESCTGGAHGFLAGRAIWADAVAETDYRAAMTTRSVRRLQELWGIVDRSRHAG